MSPVTWTYQPPKRPDGYADQCYYRAGQYVNMVVADATADSPQLEVYRQADSTSLRITIEHRVARMATELDLPSLRALHAALSDALQDIEAVEGDRERCESFEAIQDELSQLEDGQQPGVYYGHPDVHYVHPDQVVAKVQELEAAGVKRYMVMPDPAIVDARLPTGAPSELTEEALYAELEAYCKAQSLPHHSADELAASDDVTEAQADWLRDYCARWDALMAVSAS